MPKVNFWAAMDVAVPLVFAVVVAAFVATGRAARLWQRAGTTPRILTAVGLALWLAEIISASLSSGSWSSFHDNAVLASVLLPAFVVAAKNRPLWLGVGIVFPLVWVVPTFRLAPPRSMWARGVYDEALRDRAAARFGDSPSRDWSRPLSTVVLALVLVFIVGRGFLLPVIQSA